MFKINIIIININDAAHANSFWGLYGSKAKLYISTERDDIS